MYLHYPYNENDKIQDDLDEYYFESRDHVLESSEKTDPDETFKNTKLLMNMFGGS